MVINIVHDFLDTVKTQREHVSWKEWRASELERDIQYCHPRWTQEAKYINAEIKEVRNLSLISGSESWIYFDWLALLFILATIISHATFFHFSSDLSKKVHHYLIMPLLLILWIRMFKYARPFERAGPFIVIFGSVTGDIIQWSFLTFIIFIPYACAFWITFSDISLTPAAGYKDVSSLLYNIFSMMVVNEHNFKDLEKANPFMARLLCGSFIGIGAIVTLNLLIALLTNTFERLYENAIANAVMQRARTILLLEKSLWHKQQEKYYDFIVKEGSPEIISKNIGRLLSLDREEATIERVRDDVKVITSILAKNFGKGFQKGKKPDLEYMKMDINKVRRFQEEIVVDVRNMKSALDEMKKLLLPIINNSNAKKNTAIKENNSSASNDESKHTDSNNSSSDDDRNETSKEHRPDKKQNNKTFIRKKDTNDSKKFAKHEECSIEINSSNTDTQSSEAGSECWVKYSPNIPKGRKFQMKEKPVKQRSIKELRKKFEANIGESHKKENINVDGQVELQDIEGNPNGEYSRAIPNDGNEMSENNSDRYKPAYSNPWPLLGMCHSTSSIAQPYVPDRDYQYDIHQQQLDDQIYPVEQESNQVIMK